MKGRTKVVIINGMPLSGKDTFTELCAKYCSENEIANVLNISSVEPIKSTLAQYGWDGNKDDDARDLIAGIKKLWIKMQNGPTTFLFTNITNFHMIYAGDDNICFCHIREPEEISKLVKVLHGMDEIGIDVKTLLVLRDYAVMSYQMDARDSDNFDKINSYTYDITIENNGTVKELEEIAEKFVDVLLEGVL